MIEIKGLRYALPGKVAKFELGNGTTLQNITIDFPDDYVKKIEEVDIPLDGAQIMGGWLVIPGYWRIKIGNGKKWYKTQFVEWYYDNDDQIAIMLNGNEQAIADMQAVREAAGEFADKIIKLVDELRSTPQFVPETGTVEIESPEQVIKEAEDEENIPEE